MKRPPLRAVAACLFGSGLCALVYQIAWLRELRLVFGASTAASAAVLAVFMGGLGAGGLVFGKRAASARRPLGLYARLEFGIAVASALTPLFIVAARALYAAVGGTPALGLGLGTVARLVLSAVVLGVPTLLMGGTLPAAAQAVTRTGDVGRRDLAVLYGANTLGAVAGAALATFVLLEALGTRTMLLSACALNLVVALAARLLSSRMPEAAHADAPAEAVATVDEKAPPPRFALAAAALVGFAFLLMELVWYRMLAPLLGGSSYTFGLILAVALLGIGLGGVAYAWFGGKRAATASGFALTCGLEALAMALPLALGDRITVWAATLRPLGSIGFGGYVAGWTAITALVVLPAAFVSGVQFPLLIALYGRGRGDVGRQVGHAYAWNTAGAIAGSLAGGFGLMPLLSAPGCWRAAAALLALLGLAALVLARPRLEALWPPLVAGLLALALLGRPGPTAAWRHGSVGVGRAPSTGTPNSLEDWLRDQRRHIVWETDGVESSVALNDKNGLAFVVNGKVDGNARSDASTQVMAGLMGALVHPTGVHRALVVGLGTGSTAGWLGDVPTMERVDVVELEPAILEVARRCAPVNRDVLSNPRVHVTVGDAREIVGTTRARYDLIFSEPSNPYRAGIASLFTEELYRAASAHLADDGLFVQWLQAYNVDAQTIRTIYATLASVFPEVETWITEESDLLLVAAKRPLVYDIGTLRQRIGVEPWKTALGRVWRADDLEGVFARYVANAELARALAAVEGRALNTDDRTRVEFGFARGLGFRKREFDVDELRAVAREHRFDRPRTTNGALDAARLGDERIEVALADWRPTPEPPANASAEARHRAAALSSWQDGDFADAVEEWRAQPAAPKGSIELAALAESLADAGDGEAERYIAALRPVHSVESAAFLARLRLRQGRVAEAADALEVAFAGLQTDPWPIVGILDRTIPLAVEIAARDAAAGKRLFKRLERPFVVRVGNDRRERTRLALAWTLGWTRLCTEALAPLEPAVPWTEELLVRRLRCYEANHDPRVDGARRDLARFFAREPLRFGTGL